MKKRSGFVAIIGRPNVGKSTLLNYLVGEKLAGVSAKPQTTRGVIRGIVTKPEGQAIYVDTPGLHKPHDALGEWMIKEIEKAVYSVDLVYWLVLPEKPDENDMKILEIVKKLKVPVILVVSQVDRFPKPEILPILDYYQQQHSFQEIIPISVNKELQVDLLLEKTFEHLTESEYLYPEDQISDQQEKKFVEEIIREKIFRNTGKEVPYASCVSIDKFKEEKKGILHIDATISVERDSQKAIVIGKKGEKLKNIGQAARLDIEKFMGCKVFLQLWVKTAPDWSQNKNTLKQMGYE